MNKPITRVRQPLLAAPSALPLRYAVAMLLAASAAVGGGATIAVAPWQSQDATQAAAAAMVAAPVQRPALTAEQIQAQAEENRRQMLAERIAAEYRRPLEDMRVIVDSAHDSGQRHGVDPLMLLAIAAVESSFDRNAVSSVGAQGLLQALPRAHPEKFARLREEGRSPFDPVASMDLGGQIYAEYMGWYDGDRTLALQQYNGNLKDQTRRYTNKVMKAYGFLSAGLPTDTTSRSLS